MSSAPSPRPRHQLRRRRRHGLLDAAESCLLGGESFTAGTKVLLASGAAIAIRQLKPGDKVLATNTKSGKPQAETVAAVWTHHDTDLYDLKIRAGTKTAVIDTTSSHLFWVPAPGGHGGQWAKSPDEGLYQRAPIRSLPVPGSAHADWNPSAPASDPVVAVTFPHGSNACDPASTVPAAVNWPSTSPCASVNASTPDPPPAAPIPARAVPDGSHVYARSRLKAENTKDEGKLGET